MVRIRGQIGQWPVDLTVELDAADWANLAASLPVVGAGPAAPAMSAAQPADDRLWQAALDL